MRARTGSGKSHAESSAPRSARTAARRSRSPSVARARGERASHLASRVAAIPEVREALLNFQRNFAENPPDGRPGVVLDGRDIGTVVCPGADVKIFVTASAEERARRRHKELLERGEESIYARVLQDLQVRDARDSERRVSPLRAAEDAIVLDTTELDSEAALKAALEIVAAQQA